MQRVARTIVRTNLSVKEKDLVTISTGPDALKFAESIAYECAIIGAQPSIFYGSDELSLKIYKVIRPKFLKNWPKLADALSKLADVRIHLDDSNPFLARQLPQDRIEISRKTYKPIRNYTDARLKRKDMKAALVGFPTKETAKAMGISYRKLSKIFWDTVNIDYNKLYKYNAALMRKLKGVNKIRIVGEKTDLTFSVRNRKIISDCGIVEKEILGYLNLPAGEVFTAPVETSANGEIYFDLPCMYHYGKQVEGVWFKFRKGKVIKYKINKGLKNFEDVIKNASGQKTTIGELGIGTNLKAKITGGMIIVDEKVKGTIHLAIGHNKHMFGKNDATIHWDFFKDMKKGGMLYADGKLIMKNGKLVV